MKKFLVLALIYTLNIMIFLFAKSAGAAVVYDTISDLKTESGRGSFKLQGHQEIVHLNGRSPAVECLKKANRTGAKAGLHFDDNNGIVLGCKLAVR